MNAPKEQVALFFVSSPEVARPKGRPKGSGKPKWSRYTAVVPHRCDDCVQVLYEASGNAPLTRQAKYRRKTDDGERYLCLGHAQQWRQDDELPKLLGPQKP